MSVSVTTKLNQCGNCNEPFTKIDFPKLDDIIVSTSCFHLYHKTCLSHWLVSAKNSACPLCKEDIQLHQIGKDVNNFWATFLEALEKDRELVLEVLNDSNNKNVICASGCLQELKVIPIYYDSQQEKLFHSSCHSSGTQLTMPQLAKVIHALVKKNDHLKPHFTPSPPTLLQTVQIMNIKHPVLSKVLALGSISFSALAFNHLNKGSNPLFSAVSIPASATLSFLRHAGVIFHALLTEQPNSG